MFAWPMGARTNKAIRACSCVTALKRKNGLLTLSYLPRLFFSPCSGPCMTLVLTRGGSGEGVVEDIRKLLGPKDVEQAKEEVPDRWAVHFLIDHSLLLSSQAAAVILVRIGFFSISSSLF